MRRNRTSTEALNGRTGMKQTLGALISKFPVSASITAGELAGTPPSTLADENYVTFFPWLLSYSRTLGCNVKIEERRLMLCTRIAIGIQTSRRKVLHHEFTVSKEITNEKLFGVSDTEVPSCFRRIYGNVFIISITRVTHFVVEWTILYSESSYCLPRDNRTSFRVKSTIRQTERVSDEQSPLGIQQNGCCLYRREGGGVIVSSGISSKSSRGNECIGCWLINPSMKFEGRGRLAGGVMLWSRRETTPFGGKAPSCSFNSLRGIPMLTKEKWIGGRRPGRGVFPSYG